jgi:hypothetical protein
LRRITNHVTLRVTYHPLATTPLVDRREQPENTYAIDRMVVGICSLAGD